MYFIEGMYFIEDNKDGGFDSIGRVLNHLDVDPHYFLVEFCDSDFNFHYHKKCWHMSYVDDVRFYDKDQEEIWKEEVKRIIARVLGRQK